MRTISASDTSLEALLDHVERGEEWAISRNGKIIAELRRPRLENDESSFVRDEKAIREAVDAILEFGKNRRLEGTTVKELIEDGRM